MLNLQTIDIIENGCDNNLEYYQAVQSAINSGNAWSFQGSYGRLMMDAIESGYCMLGRTPCRDYWGNLIPARDDVEDGTKGSYGYVAEMNGAEWADAIAGVV